MLNCRQVTNRASDYLDEALPFWERLQMQLHLALCHHCRRYLKQLRATVWALSGLPKTEVSEDTVRQVVQLLKKE
ncbi:MAG: zf-HC2 domain-containing protein [Gammaproteobacteria bacterium]